MTGHQSCICLFSSLYSPNVGGVETYTESLARALTDKGFHVVVVTCNTHHLARHSAENGIEVFRLPCMRVLGGRYPVPLGGSDSNRIWESITEANPIYSIVNTRFYPLSVKALAFSSKLGIKPVLIEHGSAHLTLGSPMADRAVETIEHIMTRRCKRLPADYYGVSKKASEWLRHFNIESQGEIPNSINADEYANNASNRSFRHELNIPENALLVSFVGRLVPEKGVIEMMEAVCDCDDENIFAAIAGVGPLYEKLKASEARNIRLLGKLSREDTSALLLQSDLMCLPSRSEGFATTLLEAAACGTPSLVTNVGGVAELIPDESFGTILSSISPREIALELRRALENRHELLRKGEASAELVRKQYSWSATAEKAITACQRAQMH